MPKQLDPTEIAAEITRQVRQMGEQAFYEDYPQTIIRDQEFFGPKSQAYTHWIEGWEMAAVEAYSRMMEEKQKWLVEQAKRETSQ